MAIHATVDRFLGKTPWALAFATLLGATGCQVQVGGQTLPSPHYLTDDVQYFGPGPEFKLAREAAAQKAFANERAATAAGAAGANPIAAPPPPNAPPPPPPGPGAGAGTLPRGNLSNPWMFSNDGIYATGS
jgi:hypothetical protein